MSTNFLGLSRRKWRERGYYVEGTESIIRLGGMTRRKDLFGFADLVALAEDGSMVLLQVTSWKNVPARVRKILTETTGLGQHTVHISTLAGRLLTGGARIVVEGWRQPNGPGTRWKSREREITPEELA